MLPRLRMACAMPRPLRASLLPRPQAVAATSSRWLSSAEPLSNTQDARSQRFGSAPQWQPGGTHKYAVPTPWLGAYYTLRENDVAVQKKRERLCGRREPSRGRFIVRTLNEAEVIRMEEKEPWRKGEFKTADFVEVEHRASLSDPVERIVGIVLGRTRRGLASSLYLLCQIDGVAVEYKFMLYSPLLLSLEVRGKLDKRPKTRKIYYMRERLKDISMPAVRRPEADAKSAMAKKGGKKKKK